MTADLERLRQVIRDLHGVEGTHVRSEDVRETFHGKVAWEGTVEVFSITGHSLATTVYAWSFVNNAGNREHVAVLGVSPVNSAWDAVRAAIAAASRLDPEPYPKEPASPPRGGRRWESRRATTPRLRPR